MFSSIILSTYLYVFISSPLAVCIGPQLYQAKCAEYDQTAQALQVKSTASIQEKQNEKNKEHMNKQKKEKDEELESLVKEIESIQSKEKSETKEKKNEGGAFNLNKLNPEISVTGDILGLYTLKSLSNRTSAQAESGVSLPEILSDEHVFKVREVEFSFVSMLDPYSRMKAFLSYEDGGLHLEEAFIEYLSLPGHIRLGIGRQYQYLGLLNRWHSHAYPQIDRPPALRELVSEESLGQTGLHIQWLLPWWWSTSGELNIEILMGDHETFQGSDLKHPAWNVFLKNYFDLSPEWYFEFGGALAGGRTQKSPPLQRRIYNGFLRLNWTPVGLAKYRGLDVWVEVFYNNSQEQRLIPLIGSSTHWSGRWGGFAFIQYRFTIRVIAGFRIDYIEGSKGTPQRWFYSPYITIWQSEWVRLRFQYTLEHLSGAGTHQSILFQLTWAAGPHKHEAY